MCQVWYGTSCYYFVLERVDWQKALQNCSDGGAQLVAINNTEENTFLQNYIRSRPDLDTKPANGSKRKDKRTKILIDLLLTKNGIT